VVLYITYDGLLEPLGTSQVLSYVRGVRRAGLPITVLSFEKPDDLADEGRVQALEGRLDQEGIHWLRCRYHGRPTLPATALDVLIGRRLVRRWSRRSGGGSREPGPRIVHARGYLPALMGAAAAGAGDVRLLFDMRGFWVDERIEAGYWSPGGIPARVGRVVERRALRTADHLILLTQRGSERVGDLLPRAAGLPATVIPTCVDMEAFRPPDDPAAARRALGLGEGPVLIHAGTVEGWYDGEATLAVARAFVERTGGRFVLLTRQVERARSLADGAGVDALVRFVPPEEMPTWLQAADAGLALVRPSPAKDASYPTRIGEYLASGLAVLTTPIGDLPDLAVGSLVELMHAGGEPEEAAARLADAAARPDRRERARALAVRELSLESGVARLVEVYRSLGVSTARES
jgi:glycosyltransferase involved in cell wall biosynthesis